MGIISKTAGVCNMRVWLLVLVLFSVYFTGCSPAKPAQPVDTAIILQNPEAYDGKVVEVNGIVASHVYVGSASGNTFSGLFLAKSLEDAKAIEPWKFNPDGKAIKLFKEGKPIQCADYSGFMGSTPRTECSHNLTREDGYIIKGIFRIEPSLADSSDIYDWSTYNLEVTGWKKVQ